MILVFALFGLAIGWLMNQVSDYFPRAATHKPAALPQTISWSSPALWQVIRRQTDQPWIGLHAATEAASMIFMVYLWLWLGASWLLVPYTIAYLFFALVTVIDIKYRLVLNVLVYPAGLLVLLVRVLFEQNQVLTVVLGGAFAFLIFYGTAYIRPNGLGGGDVKLAVLIGFLFGFPGILFALLLGAAATAVFIVAALVTRRGSLQTQIPYAPFLCFGALAALLLHPIWIGNGVLF